MTNSNTLPAVCNKPTYIAEHYFLYKSWDILVLLDILPLKIRYYVLNALYYTLPCTLCYHALYATMYYTLPCTLRYHVLYATIHVLYATIYASMYCITTVRYK